MITSKFFIPEFETDDDSSVEVFRYTPLKTEKDAVKYPIYVVFKNNSIEFQFQGKIQTNSNNDLDYLFVNAPIFVLPLGEKKYEETNDVIKGLFDKKISIKPYEIWEDNKEKFFLKRKAEYYIETNPTKYDYSKLKTWGNDNDEWSKINWIETIPVCNGNDFKEIKNVCKLKQKFLRRLFLDFLDDFFNANVFRQSPLYESIKAAILDSYILKGIYLKADFYSKKAFFKANDNDELHKARYFDALDKWTSFITTDEHKKLFATERTKSEPEAWFDFSDNEITNALISRNFILKATDDNQNKKNEVIKRSANFLIKNYEIAKSALILVCSNVHFTIPLLLSIIVIGFFLLQTQKLKLGYYSVNFIISTILGTTIIYYFLGKLNGKLILLKLIKPISILSIIFFWGFSFFFTKKYDTILLNNDWHFLIVYSCFAFCLGAFFVFYSIFNSSAINLILPRLLMAMLTAWIAILVALDSWKSFFDISVISSIKYGSILILFTGFFLIFEIRRNTKITDFPKMIWKALNVVIPAYILSLTIGLVGLSVLAEKNLKESDFFETKSVRKKIYELKEYDNEKDKWENGLNILEKTNTTERTEKIITKHKKISNGYIVDFLMQKENFENPDILYKKKESFSLILENGSASPQCFIYTHQVKIPYFGEHKIKIIPGFLILMSAFALFSGIFLTLLFDDKPVTDPL